MPAIAVEPKPSRYDPAPQAGEVFDHFYDSIRGLWTYRYLDGKGNVLVRGKASYSDQQAHRNLLEAIRESISEGTEPDDDEAPKTTKKRGRPRTLRSMRGVGRGLGGGWEKALDSRR